MLTSIHAVSTPAASSPDSLLSLLFDGLPRLRVLLLRLDSAREEVFDDVPAIGSSGLLGSNGGPRRFARMSIWERRAVRVSAAGGNLTEVGPVTHFRSVPADSCSSKLTVNLVGIEEIRPSPLVTPLAGPAIADAEWATPTFDQLDVPKQENEADLVAIPLLDSVIPL